MKNKLIKNINKTLLAAAITFVAAAGASAAGPDVSYSLKTGNAGEITRMVHIKASDSLYAELPVNLKIWYGDKTQSDYNGKNLQEVFALIDQIIADENGNFEFAFPFNKAEGTYKADIKIGDNEIQNVFVEAVETSALSALVTKLNDKNSINNLAFADFSAIYSDGENYGIDTTIYNQLSSKENVAEAVAEKAGKLLAAGKTVLCEDFVELTNECVLLEAFASTDNGTVLANAIDIYSEFMGIKDMPGRENILNTFNALGNKEKMASSMGYTKFDSMDKFIEAVCEKFVVYGVKNVKYYTEMANVIEPNAEYINFGDSYANYLANENLKTYILKFLTDSKNSIETIAQLKNVFNLAYNSYGNSNSPTQGSTTPGRPGTGSGGGGGGGGSYGNVSVPSGITIPATAPVTVAKPSFTDVDGHWAKDAIYKLVDLGVVSGKSSTQFCPQDMVTREEFVKMIISAFGFSDENAKNDFYDVGADRWSAPYIAVANSLGIVQGDGNSFMPEKAITREDMAIIIYRSLNLKNPAPERGEINVLFEDFDEISTYAKNSVAMLFEKGIVSGDGKNFNPHMNTTRAEAAQIIVNALKGGTIND